MKCKTCKDFGEVQVSETSMVPCPACDREGFDNAKRQAIAAYDAGYLLINNPILEMRAEDFIDEEDDIEDCFIVLDDRYLAADWIEEMKRIG